MGIATRMDLSGYAHRFRLLGEVGPDADVDSSDADARVDEIDKLAARELRLAYFVGNNQAY